MPEIGPSGSEGGVALTRHPYPYRTGQVHGELPGSVNTLWDHEPVEDEGRARGRGRL